MTVSVLSATFLISFGLIQLTAGFWKLRGLSATGSLHQPGVMLGFLTFVGGVYLALVEPIGALLLLALPGLLAAAVASVLAGIVTSWLVNPTRSLLHPDTDAHYTASEMRVPAPGVGDGAVPATWFNQKADQSHPAVLLICGASDNRLAFKWRIIGECLAHGFNVLTIDPPGHGEFRSAPMTLANARAACRSAVNWLDDQPGVGAVGVCGISLGGCQAADLAARDGRVAAVALMCTPAKLTSVTSGTYAREIAGLFLPRNLALLREASVLTLWREWRSMKAGWFGGNLYQLIDEFDSATAARDIGERPVLIIHGTRDAAVPVSNAYALYQATPPAHELLLVRQATHISLVLYPEEMKRMAEWLAGHLR